MHCLNAKQKYIMLTFLKNWTLPIAMLFGTFVYLIFANTVCLNPIKPAVYKVIEYATPFLIFAQLLLTFCKVNPKGLIPTKWHLWLLIFQLLTCLIVAAAIIVLPVSQSLRYILEGAMVCLICPTATAAAVITGKLGGNVSGLTTYTLLSNILAAIIVPLVFPLMETHNDMEFITAFLRILSKVFPLLLLPFIIAILLRILVPKAHKWLFEHSGIAFYLWGIALAIVSGQTVRSLLNADASISAEIGLCLAGLITCCIQFYIGKRIGTAYGDRISAGQALGQKNTVLAIWMAYTYLNPLSSVAPGSYVLWQNTFNSWQLWKKRKAEKSQS